MVSNVLKSAFFVQVCSLKRDIVALLMIFVIHFLVLQFAMKSPNQVSKEDREIPKCESFWFREYPDHCSYTVRKRDILLGTNKSLFGRQGSVGLLHNKTESLDSNMNLRTCCDDESVCGSREYDGNFKSPIGKELVVYPADHRGIQAMFDNARKIRPNSIFHNLRYVEELKDDLYSTSSIVIIVNELLKTKFVYTVKNNVFSESYRTDFEGSDKIVDKNLTLQMPGNPSKSSEELVTIQTAVNEAYWEYLGLKPAKWKLCIFSSKNHRREEYSNLLEDKRDHLNSWLYISVSVLLLKLVSDIINSTSIIKILKYNNMDASWMYIMKVLQYETLSIIMICIPFFINKSFGYEYTFPCFNVKLTAFAIFTFYVSSISFTTFAASFFTRKSTGITKFFLIWVSTHFLSKWIMECAPNNATLILLSMLPAGGLYASLSAILSFEVMSDNHTILALLNWPRTPTKMIPLGLIWFMMWLSAIIYSMLLNANKPKSCNRYRSIYSYFSSTKSTLIQNLRFLQRLCQLKSFNTETDPSKRPLTSSSTIEDFQTFIDGEEVHFLNKSTLEDNYTVLQNTITVVLGSRLSGKSSLLSRFAENPFSGPIFLHSNALSLYEDDKRNYVGLSTRECGLEQNLTTYEHLMFSALLKGFNIQEGDSARNKIVSDLDLNEIKHTKIKNLDVFQEFKVGVSVALVGNPKLLVLDELTSKLVISDDRKAAWDLLLQLRKTLTILMSSISPEEADYIGDYVGIVDKGNFLSFGTISHLRKVHNEHYTIRFIPEASRSPDAYESLLKLAYKVYRDGMQLVVTCDEDKDISKIMQVVEEYVDPFESKIETSYPLLVNIYANAISFDIHESSAVVSSYLIEEDAVSKDSSWWNKIKAHYIRMLWYNQNSLKLILSICFIIGVTGNPTINYCFNRNNELPSIPIQTSYFDEPSELRVLTKYGQSDYNANERPSDIIAELQTDDFYSLPVAITQIYNELLSNVNSSITTYHQPYVTIPKICWQNNDTRNYTDFEELVNNGTYKSPDTCYFYVMKLFKYLFVSSSVIMAVVHQTERTTGQLEIHYLTNSNVYIYWGAAFLAGLTITSAIYFLIIIKLILILPSDELLSNNDIHWNLLVLFLYGMSHINSNNFFSLFFKQRSNLITACALISSIPLIIENWNFIVSCFEIPQMIIIEEEWLRFEESVLRYLYDSLMVPKVSSSLRSLYCSVCKDLFQLRADGVQRGWIVKTEKLTSILLLTTTIICLFMIIVKEKWFSRKFLCAFNPIDENFKMKAEWMQEESRGKGVFKLVISGTICKQLPMMKSKIIIKRGTCIGLLRNKDLNISHFMKAIMKMPENNMSSFFKNNEGIETLSRSMGYCNGQCELPDDMTGRQQLLFVARIRGLPGSFVNIVVNIWLGVMGLSEIADLRSREYDVNDRKKLEIAAALIGAPFLAILEEPTAGVDFRTRHTILSVIKQCCKVKNQSLFIVTEDPTVCEAVCDQALILHKNVIKFNADITTLNNTLYKEYVIIVKLDSSASEQNVSEVKKSLFQEFFPDLEYTNRRGVWHYFVLSSSQLKLSSVIGQMEKFKTNHEIIREIFVNFGGVDHVLTKVDTYLEFASTV